MSFPLLTPEDLVATSNNTTTITLTWTDTEEGISCDVQRKEAGGTYGSIGSGETPYVDSTCSASTRYYYRIRYDNGAEQSDWSNEDDAYTYPNPPTGLAVSFSGKTATLTWTNGSVYDYIGVYYKLSADPSWTTDTTTLSGTAVTRDITVATESASYDFRVRGYISASTLWSTYNTWPAIVSGVTKPSGLAGISGGTSNVALTWTDNSSVEDGYEVWYYDSPDWLLFETTAADATSSDVTGLTQDEEYKFKVRAKDGAAYSDYSNEVTVYVKDPPAGTPGKPTAAVTGQNTITVTWTDTTTGLTRMYLYQSPDASVWTELGYVAAGVETYPVTGLTSYTDYYFKTRAWNLGGWSATYSADSDKVTTDVDVDPPTALIAEALSSTQIKISFTINAGDATDHYVERKISGGSYSAVGSVGDGTTAEYTDATCSANTEYTYRIRAYHSSAYGDYSSAVTKKTLAVGGDAARRYETYFAMGKYMLVMSETPQSVIEAYWRSKPLDFSEADPADADRFKTVNLVQLEYNDTYASVPIVVSLSTDGGTTWTTSSETVGTGDKTDKVHNFYFAGVTGKYITLKISSTDTDTKFSWTGIIIHYTSRGEYVEV